MRAGRIGIIMLVAVVLSTGFFGMFAAATGTGFDDAQAIGEGTYSGTVSTNDYYYVVTVPAYKAILVTIEAGSNSTVSLDIYNSDRQQVAHEDHSPWVSDGERDLAFYDGMSSSDYEVYIQLGNIKFGGVSSYTIKVEFRPSDMMSAAVSVTDGQTVSGTIKYSSEVHWYKINVPKGKLLNVTFNSNGGDVAIDLYDAKNNLIDTNDGTQGSVDTKLLGQTGTIYIKVTAYEYNNDVSYSFTPHLKTGSSDVQQAATGFSVLCIGGIVIVLVVIILLVLLVVRKKKSGQPSKPQQ